MSLLTIGAELPNFDRILDAVTKARSGKGLPYTKEAIRSATVDVVQRTWLEYASGVTVQYSGGAFRIRSVTGDYLRSIQDGLRFPDAHTGEVFSTSPHAAIIEDGIKPFDMRAKMLKKAKVGKNGVRYITVAFRHGTPGTTGLQPMPNNVYQQAKKLGFSRKNNALVAFFTGKKYTWNGRLHESPQGQRSHVDPHLGSGYTWKTGQFSGMVKMGKPGHTQYLTFRRISENSSPLSWKHPGVKPRPIRDAVVENTREEVLQLIRNGFAMDLYFMGLGGDA